MLRTMQRDERFVGNRDGQSLPISTLYVEKNKTKAVWGGEGTANSEQVGANSEQE